MTSYLAESADYKVYALYENVYLKRKATSPTPDGYAEEDECIAWHYGDPAAALIMPDGKHIIVAGCGLSVYNVEHRREIQLMAEPGAVTWTNGLHQDGSDDSRYEFRFVAYNAANQMRVFRLSLLTQLIEQLD
jgi:hypothetical protein